MLDSFCEFLFNWLTKLCGSRYCCELRLSLFALQAIILSFVEGILFLAIGFSRGAILVVDTVGCSIVMPSDKADDRRPEETHASKSDSKRKKDAKVKPSHKSVPSATSQRSAGRSESFLHSPTHIRDNSDVYGPGGLAFVASSHRECTSRGDNASVPSGQLSGAGIVSSVVPPVTSAMSQGNGDRAVFTPPAVTGVGCSSGDDDTSGQALPVSAHRSAAVQPAPPVTASVGPVTNNSFVSNVPTNVGQYGGSFQAAPPYFGGWGIPPAFQGSLPAPLPPWYPPPVPRYPPGYMGAAGPVGSLTASAIGVPGAAPQAATHLATMQSTPVGRNPPMGSWLVPRYDGQGLYPVLPSFSSRGPLSGDSGVMDYGGRGDYVRSSRDVREHSRPRRGTVPSHTYVPSRDVDTEEPSESQSSYSVSAESDSDHYSSPQGPSVRSRSEPVDTSATLLLEALTAHSASVLQVKHSVAVRSHAESALGGVLTDHVRSQIAESPLIADSLSQALRSMQDASVDEGSPDEQSVAASAGSAALPVGKLIPPSKSAIMARGLLWDHSSFRSGFKPTPISQTDLSRLGLARTPLSASVSDQNLRFLERASARALTSLGAMDTVLGALIHALSADTASQFSLHSQPDESAVRILFPALANGIRQCALELGGLYANTILLRRDAALAGSQLPKDVQAGLRTLPFARQSLFGSAADPILHGSAQRSRDDLVLAAVREVSRPSKRRPPYAPKGPPRKMPKLFRSDVPPPPPTRKASQGRRKAKAKRQGAPQRGKHPQ